MLSRSFVRISCVKSLFRSNINRLIAQRNLHVSALVCQRKFKAEETDFISKFVRTYKNSEISECKQTFKLQENYKEKSTEDLISDFEALSHYCIETETFISDDAYDGFVKALSQRVPKLNDDQLTEVLTHFARFPPTPSGFSKNFHELWLALDEKCVERTVKEWKHPMILKVCNLWYKLNLSKIGDFTGKGITKVFRRVDRLTPSALVEAMFYLTVCRKKIPLSNVESRFLEVFDELSIDEIGIICLAFFKTESRIGTVDLIHKLYRKTLKEIDNIQDITLTNIVKVLRYSSSPSHSDMIEKLSIALVPIVKNASLITCLHITLLGTNLQYCHHPLIEEVVKKYNDNIGAMRLKEIERITFMLALFNFKTESGVEKELLRKIVDELKSRADEAARFPKCLSSCAYYLSVCGVHDVEIIRSVLKESFIEFAFGKNKFKIGREILCLDSFTRINLRSTYEGPQLSEKLRANIAKFQTHYIPYRGQKYKLTHSDMLTLDLKEFMERQFGENTLVHVLPHFERPDIVYCFDENGKSVTKELINCFPANYNGEIIFKESVLSKRLEMIDNMEKYRMVAIVLGGWNLYLRDTNQPTGELRMKLEQLEIVGYKPILMNWQTWMKMNIIAKEKYLNKEITRALSC